MNISEQLASLIESARQNGLHISSEPVTLPVGYACPHCGGTLAALERLVAIRPADVDAAVEELV